MSVLKINDRIGSMSDECVKIKAKIAQFYELASQDKITPKEIKAMSDALYKWMVVTFKDLAPSAISQFFATRALKKKINKLEYKDSLTEKQTKSLKEAYAQLKQVDNAWWGLLPYWNEIIVLWYDLIEEFRVTQRVDSFLQSFIEDRRDYYKADSLSVEQVYNSILDKLPEGEEIQFESAEEEHLFERCMAFCHPWCPVVLDKIDIDNIKNVAERYGVKCKLIAWEPQIVKKCLQELENGAEK